MAAKFLAFAGACIALLVYSLRFMNTMRRGSGNLPPPHQRFTSPPANGAGLTKTQAEDLLDWFEAHGIHDRRVSYLPGKGFIVR
ncbi:MAG TPA: hypothetical protein VK395_05190 [Gemmataceae bacterium]|nr:hypothetical protein [Gemmataceae bacterium]